LIALKDAEIRKCGFEFQYELSPLSHLNVLDHELCSLAGNLLDNAIEACVSERIPDTVIQFKILHIRDMLFLQCSNPTAKNPSVISRDRIATTKDPNVHGFGIPIMESIVRKYGGIYDMKIENGQFKVLISIPLLPV
ncbi:MAG: GHKL domain-containing protein, partial [Lachnospiraceae bacterium]|nr:GHKL domain-containing protein [Lachnospiraceae bacterium]